MKISDFWWLSTSQRSRYKLIKFGHHRPIQDDENPRSVSWDTDICSIDELEHWCDRFQNINVYRSLMVESASSDVEEVFGPFLVDIDNGDEDLDDALVVTRKIFYLLSDEFRVDTNSIKIFFTGHKGFNLEIRPQALSIQGSVKDQIRQSTNVLHQITESLRRGEPWQTTNRVSSVGTVVDQIYGDRFCYTLKHPYTRLHDSLNKWISSDGKTNIRKKIELTAEELNQLPASEITSRAGKLATQQ